MEGSVKREIYYTDDCDSDDSTRTVKVNKTQKNKNDVSSPINWISDSLTSQANYIKKWEAEMRITMERYERELKESKEKLQAAEEKLQVVEQKNNKLEAQLKDCRTAAERFQVTMQKEMEQMKEQKLQTEKQLAESTSENQKLSEKLKKEQTEGTENRKFLKRKLDEITTKFFNEATKRSPVRDTKIVKGQQKARGTMSQSLLQNNITNTTASIHNSSFKPSKPGSILVSASARLSSEVSSLPTKKAKGISIKPGTFADAPTLSFNPHPPNNNPAHCPQLYTSQQGSASNPSLVSTNPLEIYDFSRSNSISVVTRIPGRETVPTTTSQPTAQPTTTQPLVSKPPSKLS